MLAHHSECSQCVVDEEGIRKTNYDLALLLSAIMCSSSWKGGDTILGNEFLLACVLISLLTSTVDPGLYSGQGWLDRKRRLGSANTLWKHYVSSNSVNGQGSWLSGTFFSH